MRRSALRSEGFVPVTSRAPLAMRLVGKFAEIRDQASRALGLAGLADVAPMQDEPMMRGNAELGRDHLEQLLLGI